MPVDAWGTKSSVCIKHCDHQPQSCVGSQNKLQFEKNKCSHVGLKCNVGSIVLV